MTPIVPVFLGDFTDRASVLAQWDGLTEELLAGTTVIVAWYEYENYNGEALIVVRRDSDGSLWEAHGSHCSCYGLEWGEWEETTREALLMRPAKHPAYAVVHAVLA